MKRSAENVFWKTIMANITQIVIDDGIKENIDPQFVENDEYTKCLIGQAFISKLAIFAPIKFTVIKIRNFIAQKYSQINQDFTRDIATIEIIFKDLIENNSKFKYSFSKQHFYNDFVIK